MARAPVQSEIATLQTQMEMLVRAVEKNADESKAGRQKIYDSLEEIKLKASHTERSIGDLNKWKEDIEPRLAILDRWKERGIGAWMFVVFISTAMGGVLIALWKWIALRLGL